MKASLFERGRGAANNAATDSRAERMTAVMHSVVHAPQIFFRLSDVENRTEAMKALSRLYARPNIAECHSPFSFPAPRFDVLSNDVFPSEY